MQTVKNTDWRGHLQNLHLIQNSKGLMSFRSIIAHSEDFMLVQDWPAAFNKREHF